MIVYSDGKKRDYLDYSPSEKDGEYIDVDIVLNAGPVKGMYFERDKSLRLVWNYIVDIGLKNTLIKILSRSAEKQRNSKFFLMGTGFNSDGIRVVFIAPKHPAIPSRIWLPKNLIYRTSENAAANNQIKIVSSGNKEVEDLFVKYAGWDPYSGDQISMPDWEKVRDTIESARLEKSIDVTRTKINTNTSIKTSANDSRTSATLFGYGNYAKTIILPSLPSDIAVTRIHEVDPTQIGDAHGQIWDTSPYVSEDDNNGIVLIAGYHHTHNSLACNALLKGAVAVVEKPLVVSRTQLDELKDAYRNGSGDYFACFHKRYSIFNSYAIQDLDAAGYQDSVNYHCIVYEVPLPDKHWYNWKNSSTRIISNGCHWIDHFLFLNDFSKPQRIECAEASDGTVAVFIELSNKACFTMTLTDIGSEKIGVQDHIELRKGEVTVKVVNGSKYISESKDRVLRKMSTNKISSYRNMYSSIGKAILSGDPGDAWESNYVSSDTVLSVNELLESKSAQK